MPALSCQHCSSTNSSIVSSFPQWCGGSCQTHYQFSGAGQSRDPTRFLPEQWNRGKWCRWTPGSILMVIVNWSKQRLSHSWKIFWLFFRKTNPSQPWPGHFSTCAFPMGGICLRAHCLVLNCFKTLHVDTAGFWTFVTSSNLSRNSYLLMNWFEIIAFPLMKMQMWASAYCKHLLQVQ